MRINEDYKVESEGYLNVVLYQRRIIKDGKNAGEETWDAIAYCPNVKSALNSLVNREINGTGLKHFKEVVKKYDELMKAIEELQFTH